MIYNIFNNNFVVVNFVGHIYSQNFKNSEKKIV